MGQQLYKKRKFACKPAILTLISKKHLIDIDWYIDLYSRDVLGSYGPEKRWAERGTHEAETIYQPGVRSGGGFEQMRIKLFNHLQHRE